MKQKSIFIGSAILLVLIFSDCTRQSGFPKLKGPYLGQKPPGMKRELFAPGILSNGLFNMLIYFTAGGKEVYFSSGFEKPFYVEMVFYSHMKDGRWVEPVELPVRRSVCFRTVINPDGTKLFFISPLLEERSDGKPNLVKIYYMDKVDDRWTSPKKIDFGDEFPHGCSQTSIASNGTLYFQAGYDIYGNADIYMSKYENGKYLKPERLSDAVNGPGHECHPFIAPDESFLLFDCDRPEGYGEFDIYVSFRDSHGEWTEAKNLGPNVNTESDERRSSVSFDGKYLFFESKVLDPISKLPEQPLTLSELQNFIGSAENGGKDFYWVDAKIIEELRPEKLK